MAFVPFLPPLFSLHGIVIKPSTSAKNKAIPIHVKQKITNIHNLSYYHRSDVIRKLYFRGLMT